VLGAATAAPHDAGMTTEPPTAARPPTRLHFIDTLRIAAFALLVLYHVGMYYVSWDWHVKSPHAGPVLEPLMRLLSPWRMSLLFLVSGVATGVLLQRPGTTLRGRLKRLLLPLLFGMALVVPPQSWLEVQQKLGWDGGYAEFLGLYASAYDGFCRGDDCLVLPTWNHLWFLPYLAVYTGLAWALVRHARGPQSVLQRGAAWLAVGPWRWLLPVAWLLATRVLLAPHFPTTHALVDDWTMHAQYAPIFLVGVLWAREPSVWADLARKRHVAAVALLLAWVVVPRPTAGELLRVDTGCLVALAGQVDFDIQYVGKIKTALFGGEGLFFAVLRGPGTVWLQSLPFSRLASRIFAAAPQTGGSREEGSVLGGLTPGLGNIFDGDND
jgi:hypothetical protein